jgi:hypothetical protein
LQKEVVHMRDTLGANLGTPSKPKLRVSPNTAFNRDRHLGIIDGASPC